jgi:hypothetical protein
MNRHLISFWLLIICVALLRADFPEVGPGVTYISERSGDTPWAVFAVKIDRSRTDLHLTTLLANNKIFELETVPDMAKNLPKEMGKPVVAINGDWFDLPAGPYQGDLLNTFIHRGELISLPSWGDTFWIDAKNQPHLDKVGILLNVVWGDGSKTPLALDGPRKDDGAALYTPVLGKSTHTKGGRELVLEKSGDGDWLPLRLGCTLTAKVKEIRETGDSPIPADGMVLSISPNMKPQPTVAIGDKITFLATSTPDMTGAETAIGGGPTLIRDSKIIDFGKGEQPRHPRTIVGWNDTHIYFIVVDGRRTNWSVGMTSSEEAQLVQRLGCTNALNLDGGGSSTLWLNDQIMNMPSDGKPRPVGNGLAVVRREDRKLEREE